MDDNMAWYNGVVNFLRGTETLAQPARASATAFASSPATTVAATAELIPLAHERPSMIRTNASLSIIPTISATNEDNDPTRVSLSFKSAQGKKLSMTSNEATLVRDSIREHFTQQNLGGHFIVNVNGYPNAEVIMKRKDGEALYSTDMMHINAAVHGRDAQLRQALATGKQAQAAGSLEQLFERNLEKHYNAAATSVNDTMMKALEQFRSGDILNSDSPAMLGQLSALPVSSTGNKTGNAPVIR